MIKQGFIAVALRYLGRLKFPTLFLITGALFVANLFFPDPLPFFDEVLLGLLTLIVAKFKDRDKAELEDSSQEGSTEEAQAPGRRR